MATETTASNDIIGNKLGAPLIGMTVSRFLVNLVLLDIKSWDPELHRKLTNADIGPVLISSRNRPTWMRFVLVPGLTDGVESICSHCASRRKPR
jgi:pyruvate-formate lyase-activating enzyme